MGVALAAISARLFELQVVRGKEYRRRAERALLLRPRTLPFVRGSIMDRAGEVLVRDEPCWEVRIDYRVLAADVEEEPDAIKREVKRWTRADRYPEATSEEEVEQAFRAELAMMWQRIAARLARPSRPLSADLLRSRALGIHHRVRRIRRAVAARRGFDSPVAEEKDAHAVVTGLNSQEQISAREAFKGYPWVRVASSSVRRFAGDGTPFAHVVGRMGRVDATDVASDPNAEDPFAKYRADERKGISGVEYAAEQRLRGRRGQMVADRRGNALPEDFIEAQEGQDVALTIHAKLQRRLYRLLGDSIRQVPESAGGAIVVLEVPTREVLALVSYPSYDPNRFGELYLGLRDDTIALPLWFRAVASRYPPGSLVKPLVCLKGLTSEQRMAHGSINVVEALKGSCNIFMYRLGERLGVDRLCDAFDMVGIGRESGIGLPEESLGINPTPDWLMGEKGTGVYPGHCRLFAMGQGEIAVTPVQAANLMATYANGRYRPLTLLRREEPAPEWTGLASEAHWTAVRQGIYEVVNDPEGTAYKYARFTHDRYVLCGKTGSATADPWPTAYRIPYVDERGADRIAILPAGARKPAIERFMAEYPGATFDKEKVEVASRWPLYPPPEGGNHSHAWFAGFLQATGADHQPDWSLTPRVAFAVLIEFGGSGGRTSGPIARTVAAEILNVLGTDL
jgi:cell division protein FtsI/penicillin-binding protein 2